MTASGYCPTMLAMEPVSEERSGGTPVHPDEDVRLMLRVRDGDAAAFRVLVEKHQSMVFGVISRMLGGVSDSEDLAQQVFIRVWKSAGRYQPKAKFTTWLMTITRNLVFNEIRRRKRGEFLSTDGEAQAEMLARHPDPNPSAAPDRAALDAELEAAVDAAIAALPETQRMAVVLRRHEELPYEEIAAVLRLSLPALKSQLFRARASLRESLAKYLDGEARGSGIGQ